MNVKLINQFNNEKVYWVYVLKWVIKVKFLSSGGLAFRGDSEVVGCPKNDNYIGYLKLFSNFDSFLEQHIKKFKNPGKGNVSRITSTICNEFMGIFTTNLHLGKKQNKKYLDYLIILK